ncbi:peptigoglycan-binding protein LysM [Streptomyces sp. Act143]|uniref:LysM peptidoglycan-binding domain-containing protein n=1 Tax=Streptomyces sp. Act143 TaxID=2200760 RepID=UPI000D677762|nr:transglycosylase family protein [Streptomyces sp. Act143]PWI16085.1 peptigoglycan-binding protein LysM [Streptomyces sp. Act143]
MLTGNGRHRRPRQAPALLVAAGVTGSAIAIPLLAATGASAADGGTWDKVAKCETDGSWSQNNGDGSYGGLNLSQENWEKFGGLDYAPSADLASRNQQIAVAEKVLADQGVGVWGACGLLNGLSQDSGSADVDTGVGSGSASASGAESDASGSGSESSGLPNSAESGSSGDASSDASDGASDDSSPSPSPSASTDADNSAKSDRSDSGQGAAQSPDSSPTVPANEVESDNSWQEGGSSSLVDIGALVADAEGGADTSAGTGRHRGASADEKAYTVREGDTLASIADSLGLDGGWRHLYAVNKKVIGSDPSAIMPGQTLVVGSE